MKKIFKYLLLTVMVFNATAFAKDTKNELKSLEETMKLYKQLNLDGDLEKTIDYVYPPVFTITPKQTLLDGFKMVKESILALVILKIGLAFPIPNGSIISNSLINFLLISLNLRSIS